MNYVAIKTLVVRELKRSTRVPAQTLGAPVVTALLFFLVFGSSIGRRIGAIDSLSYGEFIMPGLIMMNAATNSFMSVASTLMLSKMTNILSDLLVTPMTYLEMVLGFSIAAVIRSILTAVLIYGTGLFFIPLRVDHPLYLALMFLVISFAFALLGMIVGIWADNFEQLSIFPTFLLTPLSFLGGVFYSVQMLPQAMQIVSLYNPLLYMINGLRYGFYSLADVSPLTAALVVVGVLLILTAITWRMLSRGYKIRT